MGSPGLGSLLMPYISDGLGPPLGPISVLVGKLPDHPGPGFLKVDSGFLFDFSETEPPFKIFIIIVFILPFILRWRITLRTRGAAILRIPGIVVPVLPPVREIRGPPIPLIGLLAILLILHVIGKRTTVNFVV